MTEPDDRVSRDFDEEHANILTITPPSLFPRRSPPLSDAREVHVRNFAPNR